MSPTHLNLEDFPDSPYARELQHKRPRLGFAAPLEEEFLRAHLAAVRPRARIWTLLGVLLAVGFSIRELVVDGGFTAAVWIHLLLVTPISAGFAYFVWSESYERLYPKLVRVLAPLLGIMVAVFVARATKDGAPEQLAMLSLFIMAVFFFMGLRLRAALATSVLILVAFAATSLVDGLPIHALGTSLVFLFIAAGLGALICRDVELSYRKRFLEEALIGELVERDGLTGLKNRRAFDEHLLRIWQQSLRGGRRLAMLFLDVDFFKRYNDEYGHQAGDLVLRRVAQTAQGFARRPLDIAARYGGEEFAVVLYDIDRAIAADVAERLRKSVEGLGIEHRASDCAPRVTVSVGIAVVQPVIGRTPQGVVQLADEALYKAKQTGRNRCVTEGETEYATMVTGVYGTAGITKLRS